MRSLKVTIKQLKSMIQVGKTEWSVDSTMPTLEASENTFMFAMSGGRFYSVLLAASKPVTLIPAPANHHFYLCKVSKFSSMQFLLKFTIAWLACEEVRRAHELLETRSPLPDPENFIACLQSTASRP